MVSDVVVTDGDGDGEMRHEDEEDFSDDFFDAGEGEGEGAVISPYRLPLHAASESGQSSGGGTEADPVGSVYACSAFIWT